MTTRDKDHALFDHLPEDRLEAALTEEFERHFGSLPSDDQG